MAEVEVTNFEDLPIAFETRRQQLALAAPDQTVKDAVDSFRRTSSQLEVLPAI